MTVFQVIVSVISALSGIVAILLGVSKILKDRNEPIIELSRVIANLNSSVISLKESNEKIWEHINKHTPQIYENKNNFKNLEKRVDRHEGRIEKLESK